VESHEAFLEDSLNLGCQQGCDNKGGTESLPSSVFELHRLAHLVFLKETAGFPPKMQ
jgi:hypothetical protein